MGCVAAKTPVRSGMWGVLLASDVDLIDTLTTRDRPFTAKGTYVP